MPTLRDLIADGRVHIVDGAMGTMLYQKGIFLNVCFDELVIRQPDLVAAVHSAYAAAGAELIETNTFGANPFKLAEYGLAGECEEINVAAARLARRSVGPGVALLGAIGPLGTRLEPFGEIGRDEAEAAFGRQVDGLVAGGVDGFCLETFADTEELLAALRAVRRRSDLAVMAQMTVGADARTAYGTTPEDFGAAFAAGGADVVGVNCSIGPQVVLDAVERLAHAVRIPISAQPNAGLPRDVADRKIYMASPEYMAEYARRMVEAGARFVGGCCGTTPEHIKMIRAFVRSAEPRATVHAVPAPDVRAGADAVTEVPLAERSRLGRKLAFGEWITNVELVPPRGVDPEPMLAQARALKRAGVDAVNVPDGPRAQSRQGALISGLLIERDCGIEAVVHYACRDRNLLGMLSDLLGAAAAGLRNLLVITGDPPKMGPYPDATAVFDIDAIGLTNLVTRLNRGLDPGGNALGAPTRFVNGVGVNPTAPDLDRELRRLEWKAEAGACFAVTQPVFDVQQLERFMARSAGLKLPVIAGIWPLVSLRNAEFLANEVPGVLVPPGVIARMRRASDRGKEAALHEGVAIAREMIAAVRGGVAGVQVAAPLGKVEIALAVLQE
ncbi:MAG: bifunctional homocysteine S-methyltransferase/methylenetetrahydrofolate reductase [Gemmatimonadales bacterium]